MINFFDHCNSLTADYLSYAKASGLISLNSHQQLKSLLLGFLSDNSTSFSPLFRQKFVSSLFTPSKESTFLTSNFFSDVSKELDTPLFRNCCHSPSFIWVSRSFLSRLIFYKRAHSLQTSSSFSVFYNTGFLTINNFLEPFLHDSISHEISKHPLSLNKLQSRTLCRSSLPFRILSFYPPYLNTVSASKVLKIITRLLHLFGFSNSFSITKRCIYSSSFYQRIKVLASVSDHQSDVHIDTFFPSLKFWYFPERVTIEESFNYVPYSHLYTLKRMNLEASKVDDLFNNSQFDRSNASLSEVSHLQGSLRFTDSDITSLGLQKKSIHVPSNTLVLADVSGMHSRSIGHKISPQLVNPRSAIHGSIRHNAFF